MVSLGWWGGAADGIRKDLRPWKTRREESKTKRSKKTKKNKTNLLR